MPPKIKWKEDVVVAGVGFFHVCHHNQAQIQIKNTWQSAKGIHTVL